MIHQVITNKLLIFYNRLYLLIVHIRWIHYPLAIVPPSNASPSTFVVQQHAHPSSVIDNVSASSAAHSDGVWVAPPEQQARQQPQITPSFSHLQPQRPTSSFVGQPQSRLNGETEDKEYRSISSVF